MFIFLQYLYPAKTVTNKFELQIFTGHATFRDTLTTNPPPPKNN